MNKLALSLLALFLGAGAAQAAETRTFEGRVKSVDEKNLTLEVAGDTVKVAADKQQLGQIRKGQTVQVKATPDLQATKVEPMRGSFAGKQLIGTVESMQEDQATIKTLNGQIETVTIDPKMMQQVRQGQQVVVELKENPMQAKNWRATQVQPMQPGQQQQQREQQREHVPMMQQQQQPDHAPMMQQQQQQQEPQEQQRQRM